jgi:hypothetical protein
MCFEINQICIPSAVLHGRGLRLGEDKEKRANSLNSCMLPWRLMKSTNFALRWETQSIWYSVDIRMQDEDDLDVDDCKI